MVFTDIHSHIIPGVDDGSPDMETSMAMAGEAYNEGIRRIIATPHFGIRNIGYNPDKAADMLNRLRQNCAELYPDLKFYMGNEVYFDMGAVSGLNDGYAHTLANSDFVLIEFPFESSYEYMVQGIRNLVMEGYQPVLAHIERYKACIKNTARLAGLIDQGALIQMNADTIIKRCHGLLGSRSWCAKALKSGMVHFIATDAHDATSRPPRMAEAADALAEIIGVQRAEDMLFDNVEWILGE